METRSKAQREAAGADAGWLSPGIGEAETRSACDPSPPVLTPVGFRATPVLVEESPSDAERHQEHADFPPRLEISTIVNPSNTVCVTTLPSKILITYIKQSTVNFDSNNWHFSFAATNHL